MTATKPVREKEIKREWRLFDADGRVLGRLTTEISRYLIGKHKVNYVPYLDMGDYIVVINAQKIVVSGAKEETKVYSHYSGYPGGLKQTPLARLRAKRPERIIYRAVAGMLPKNKLRDRRLTRLFVFKDQVHPYGDKLKTRSLKS